MSPLQRNSLFENAGSVDTKTDALEDLGKRFPPNKHTTNNTPGYEQRDIKAFSEEHGFPSREPVRKKGKKPRVKARRKLPQTGRNEQLNIRVHPTVKERFYDVADEYNWGLGETLEHAMDALESQLRIGLQKSDDGVD